MKRELLDTIITTIMEEYGYTYSDRAKDKSYDLMFILDNDSEGEKLKQLLATVYREGFTDGFKTGTEFNAELNA